MDSPSAPLTSCKIHTNMQWSALSLSPHPSLTAVLIFQPFLPLSSCVDVRNKVTAESISASWCFMCPVFSVHQLQHTQKTPHPQHGPLQPFPPPLTCVCGWFSMCACKHVLTPMHGECLHAIGGRACPSGRVLSRSSVHQLLSPLLLGLCSHLLNVCVCCRRVKAVGRSGATPTQSPGQPEEHPEQRAAVPR